MLLNCPPTGIPLDSKGFNHNYTFRRGTLILLVPVLFGLCVYGMFMHCASASHPTPLCQCGFPLRSVRVHPTASHEHAPADRRQVKYFGLTLNLLIWSIPIGLCSAVQKVWSIGNCGSLKSFVVQSILLVRKLY